MASRAHTDTPVHPDAAAQTDTPQLQIMAQTACPAHCPPTLPTGLRPLSALLTDASPGPGTMAGTADAPNVPWKDQAQTHACGHGARLPARTWSQGLVVGWSMLRGPLPRTGPRSRVCGRRGPGPPTSCARWVLGSLKRPHDPASSRSPRPPQALNYFLGSRDKETLRAVPSRFWDQTSESQVWRGHAPSQGPGEGPSHLSQLLGAPVSLGWWLHRHPGPCLLLCTTVSLCCVRICSSHKAPLPQCDPLTDAMCKEPTSA